VRSTWALCQLANYIQRDIKVDVDDFNKKDEFLQQVYNYNNRII